MAKLILSMDGLVLKEIPLTKERVSIGRKANNNIQIDNLAISGEHAVVVTILNDAFLEDLNSTNGTLVNGHLVKKHFLKDGDIIELNKYKLKYIAEQLPQAETTDIEKTMVLRPNSMKDAPTAMASMETAATTPEIDRQTSSLTPPSITVPTQPPVSTLAMGTIQVLNGTSAGRELDLTKTLTTLGKPGVQVAVITRRPHGYFITHVEGAQFPVINGRVIDAQAHQLSDHNIIEIAGIKVEFFLKDYNSQ